MYASASGLATAVLMRLMLAFNRAVDITEPSNHFTDSTVQTTKHAVNEEITKTFGIQASTTGEGLGRWMGMGFSQFIWGGGLDATA